MKYISIIILVFIASVAVAADYGDGVKDFSDTTFIYYKLETDDKIFYAESYTLDGDNIVLHKLFIEGTSSEYSDFMIIPRLRIISIQKKTADSKEAVIKSKGNGCFINSVNPRP